MSVSKTKSSIIKFVASAALVAVGSIGVWADEPFTAYIPVKVNADATVKIAPPDDAEGAVGDEIVVTANTVATLNISQSSPFFVSVSHTARARATGAAAVNYSRGNVSVKLSPQHYGNAEINLFAVNGRRVMSGRADAGQSGLKLSRGNVAAGVYLLSVRGARGNTFSNRITHGGGRLNVDVAFGLGNAVAPPTLAKRISDDGEDPEPNGEVWTISVRAIGYRDTSYKFLPKEGANELQDITLAEAAFTDARDNKKYRFVEMPDGKTWMAENLNFETEGSWCYDNSVANCNKYGRLYTWDAAMLACPTGWHLPTVEEWASLIDFVGESPSTKLRSVTGWEEAESYIAGTDDYGFSAMPGGVRFPSGGFGYVTPTREAFLWTATEEDEGALRLVVRWNESDVHLLYPAADKGHGMSVRCVRND